MLYNCLVLCLTFLGALSSKIESFTARLTRPTGHSEYDPTSDGNYNDGDIVTIGSFTTTIYFLTAFSDVNTLEQQYVEIIGDQSGNKKTQTIKIFDNPYSGYHSDYGSWMTQFSNDDTITVTTYLLALDNSEIDSISLQLTINYIPPILTSIVGRESIPSSSSDYDTSSIGVIDTSSIYTFQSDSNIYIACVWENVYSGFTTRIKLKGKQDDSEVSSEDSISGDYTNYWRYEEFTISNFESNTELEASCLILDRNDRRCTSDKVIININILSNNDDSHPSYINERECAPTVDITDLSYDSEMIRCDNYEYVGNDCNNNGCQFSISMVV